jgi:hypothetical protein
VIWLTQREKEERAKERERHKQAMIEIHGFPLRLSEGDRREIRKACDCPRDAKKGDACPANPSIAMRCNGSIKRFYEIVAERKKEWEGKQTSKKESR